MERGDVCWYAFAAPDKRRPVLVLTRNSAIRALNNVTIAPITSTIRSIPTEVILTDEDGMGDTCAVNLDNLQTVAKARIAERITQLSSRKMRDVKHAIAFALGFDAADE